MAEKGADRKSSDRKPFIEWLQKKGLETPVVISCVLAVEKCGAFANEQGLLSEDILNISGLEQVEELFFALLDNEDFAKWNREQNNRCRTAMLKYLEFCQVRTLLESEMPHEKAASQPQAPALPPPDKESPRPQEPEQSGIISEILSQIQQTFASGASCVFLEAIMEKYGDRLADEVQISDTDILKEALSALTDDTYCCQDFCLYLPDKKPDPLQDVIRGFNDFALPVTAKDMQEKLWYIPLDKIRLLFADTASIVKMDTETYFFAPNLPLGAEELKEISIIIKRQLLKKAFITDTELKTWIANSLPSAARRLKNFTVWGFCNALGYLLRNMFSFYGGIICAVGKRPPMEEVFAQLGRDRESLTLDELIDFAAQIHSGIYWDALYREMIRVSKTLFLRASRVAFDVKAADAALDEICVQQYMPVQSIRQFSQFPEVISESESEMEWNTFLLENYVYQYSSLFRLIHAEFNPDGCFGAVVRKDSPFTDYYAIVVDFLARSSDWTDELEALQLLMEHGFQSREARADLAFDIEQAVQDAKLNRAFLQIR